MTARERQLRQAIVDQCRWMNAIGLNQGTSGNISVRFGNEMLITPSGIPYETMTPEMIAAMPLDRSDGSFRGPKKPSSEWRIHLDILRSRPEVNAVVHTHSTYATALAIARVGIPACHYMVAAFGGGDIRCSEYARFGTQELADAALAALEGRNGCLLANHGMITVGPTIEKAMWLAVELETLAKQYWLSRQIGGPVLLTDKEIQEALEAFATYGQVAPPEETATARGRRSAASRRKSPPAQKSRKAAKS